MINYIKTNKKNVILLSIIIIGVIILLMPNNNEILEIDTNIVNNNNIESVKLINEDEEIENVLKENDDNITFISDVFKIDKDKLIELLKNNQEELGILSDKNHFDKIVIEYLFSIEKKEKELFNSEKIPCSMNKDYIIKLIKYFTDIYENVDFSIAASIAHIESGYSVKYMLNKNNIYGGLYNGKLISYKNIEYGVLCYIKLLNDGYFTKGLTTVDEIGKIYNPVFNENGEKVANYKWVYNVNSVIDNYREYDSVDISSLLNLKYANNDLAN